MNAVPLAEIKREIWYDEIVLLTWFLYCERTEMRPIPPDFEQAWIDKIPQEGAYRPSLIIRSELELLGISTPRFAIRLHYLPENEDRVLVDGKLVLPEAMSFVNCRRLGTLHSHLNSLAVGLPTARIAIDVNEQHPDIEYCISDDPGALPAAEGPSLADAVLCCPRFLRNGYYIITADIFPDHGEVIPSPDLSPQFTFTRAKCVARGTPYAKSYALGGGLCAQACCYMATSIMHRHASKICGLAEITALASSPTLKELLLTGLDEYEISSYFEAVNLRSIFQFVNPQFNTDKFKVPADTEFTLALSSYVLSDIPVILGVDYDALATGDESIFARNGLPQNKKRADTPAHAILAVGCSWRWAPRSSQQSSKPSTFVLHCPSTMPWLTADVEQLSRIGICPDPDGKWDARTPFDLRYATFLPVTPAAVRMPLLSYRSKAQEVLLSGKCRNDNGKQSLSRKGLIGISYGHHDPSLRNEERQFHLFPLNGLISLSVEPHFSRERWIDLGEFLNSENIVRWFMDNFGWRGDHWVWAECGPNVLKVWDAETSPESMDRPEDPLNYLAAIIEPDISHIGFRIRKPSLCRIVREEILLIDEPPLETNGEAATPVEWSIKPAIISSFCVNGLQNNFCEPIGGQSYWPDGADAIEVYAAMSQDLPELFPVAPSPWDWTRNDKPSPIDLFAFVYNSMPEAHVDVAKVLLSKFQGKTIIGFATFFPEILAHEQLAQRAQDALCFLIKVANELRKAQGMLDTQQTLSPFNIELVAGSRIQGRWSAKVRNNPTPCFAVNRISATDAYELLLERLMPVAQLAGQHRNIQLAIELEPGPLFAVNSPNALSTICRLIRSKYADTAIQKVVGFNFDLPHWAFLNDVPLGWLLGIKNCGVLTPTEGAEVRMRIVHAHISDHYRGHFCDNVIGVNHSDQEFSQWLKFLEYVMGEHRENGFPQYSNFVSCEMEACKAGFAEVSFAKLRNLLM